jgi:hypothetical protein
LQGFTGSVTGRFLSSPVQEVQMETSWRIRDPL